MEQERHISDYRLVTSNQRKLAEFARFGMPLRAEAGADLPEVDGTKAEVVLHKAIAAGEGRVVEDTSLDVDGVDIGANVRWRLDAIGDLAGRRAVWAVYLGMNTGSAVETYVGEVAGTIVRPDSVPEGAFGFDPYFAPDGAGGLTLAELEARGEKDRHSARRLAVEALLDRRPVGKVLVADVRPWSGGWQGA